jgi:hypothetical protein
MEYFQEWIGAGAKTAIFCNLQCLSRRTVLTAADALPWHRKAGSRREEVKFPQWHRLAAGRRCGKGTESKSVSAGFY